LFVHMCCAVASIPSPEAVTPDTPPRLSVTAALALPDGSMSASGLRREVFMPDPIADADLVSMWAELGIWRDGAVIKRVP
jgi:hypothetical protein